MTLACEIETGDTVLIDGVKHVVTGVAIGWGLVEIWCSDLFIEVAYTEEIERVDL
jgi:hypothetical protein